MKYQSLLAYFLIAVAVWLLQQPSGCLGNKAKEKVTEVVYVPRTDTVTRYVTGETVVRTIIRRDTIHDRIIFKDFQEVDTAVLILYADRDESEDMRLFEGTGKGDDGKCDYKYLLGIHNDSLQFLVVETECSRETKIILESPVGLAPEPFPGRTLFVGGKMGMTLDKAYKTYGVQASYGGLYAAVDYVPAIKKPVLEAGLLFPIGRRKTLAAVRDTMTIQYR